MDMLLNIFKQLGANESLWHQFGIVVVMYYLTKFLFLNHLLNLIVKREEKTVGLAGSAEAQYKEVEKIQEEYTQKIQKVNKDLKVKLDTGKAEIVKKEEKVYREKESEINKFVEESRKKVEEEISAQKEKVLGEAQQLSSNLVERITKGL